MPTLQHFLTATILVQAIACGSAQSQTWEDVPEHVSSSMDTFRDLFFNAQTEGFGITILGDSQETIPGGGGNFYIPTLGDEFFKHYGNIPKTGLITSESQQSGWLSAAARAGAVTVEINSGLPSVDIVTYQKAPTALGALIQVNTNGYTTPFLNTPCDGYFNGHPLEATLVVRSRPNSGEVAWRAGITENDIGSYFVSEQLGSGVTNLSLAREEIEFVSETLGIFDLQGHNALQVVARSATDDRTVDIAGVYFRNTGDPSGVSVTSFARGGANTSSFLARYEAAASLFNIVAKDDVISLNYGANDSFPTSPEDFKENTRQIILRLREWTDNPDLPFLLISDPDQTHRREGAKENFDSFPVVAAELAMELNNVLALNTRLIGARNNWFVGSTDFESFAPDGVHYSRLGATMLAKWQVESLLSLADFPEPPTDGAGDFDGVGDFDADGDVDCDDIDFYIGHIGSPATGSLAQLDVDGDGQVTANDLEMHISSFVQTSSCETGTFMGDLNCDGTVNILGDAFIFVVNLGDAVSSYGAGDINLDGVVDVLGDAFILIGNLGRSNAP